MCDTETLHHDVVACVRVTEQSEQMVTSLTESLQELAAQQQAVTAQHKRELANLDEQSKANEPINQNLEREITTHKRRWLQSPRTQTVTHTQVPPTPLAMQMQNLAMT